MLETNFDISRDPKVVLIAGASSGLGLELARLMDAQEHKVVGFGMCHAGELPIERFDWTYLKSDITRPSDMATVVEGLVMMYGRLDCVINCASINRIGYLEDFEDTDFARMVDVNICGMYNLAKKCQPLLMDTKGTFVQVVSNASHVPMTASLAYNMSKAAQHMGVLQLARELTRRHGITVFGVSPNKMHSTGMTEDIERQVCQVRGWSPEEAAAYQKAALLSGEETDPKLVAEFIAFLLSSWERHKHLSGCILPYGA